MERPAFGILFDCDGTLTDSLDQAMSSFVYALSKLGMGYISEAEIHQLFGISADKILLHFCKNDQEQGARAFELFL